MLYAKPLILLRGNCSSNQKLACFVLYLKIINTYLKKCDAIWENPSDGAKCHFEKWLEIVRKLVYNSTELLNIIKL